MAEEKMRFYLSYQVKNWKPGDLKMPRFGTVAPSRAHYCVTTACIHSFTQVKMLRE
jgi:hypothetical protein